MPVTSIYLYRGYSNTKIDCPIIKLEGISIMGGMHRDLCVRRTSFVLQVGASLVHPSRGTDLTRI